MKNIFHLVLSFGIITLTLLVLRIGHTEPDSVGSLKITDDLLRNKAAFAVVEEEIAHHLNLGILTEWDYQKLHGPVLWKIRAPIHFQLREKFGRIVHTVNFGGSVNSTSPSQSPSINQSHKPRLREKAAEIIRDFIDRERISVIIRSDTPIGLGETAAIRRLRGEVRYTYESINGACVLVPIKNLTDLIKRPFIQEIWPDGDVKPAYNLSQIGAIKIHSAPATGLGVTGDGVNVAVVDGGIDSDHPEFKGRIKDTRGVLFGGGSDDSKDDIDHGTHVAGIIGAALDNNVITGVAPKTNLLDAQVDLKADSFFFRLLGDSGDTIEAIKWAAKQHKTFNTSTRVDIINMSLGVDPWVYGRDGDDPMSQLIDEVVTDGIIFVVSAGNAAERRDTADITPNSQPLQHNFSVNYSGAANIIVTLLWNTGVNDLDLAILDSSGTQVLYVSCTNPTPQIPTQDTVDGRFYEQVTFCVGKVGATSQISNYILQVEAANVQSSQDYEVWVGSEEADVFFHSPDPEGTVTAPGYSKKAITVGAIDSGKQITNFSSRGPSDTSLIKPEIVAPGKEIYSTVSSPKYYDKAGGTSMAAPHVAGVAALILDAVGRNDDDEWNFTPDEVKSAIVRSAEGLTHVPDNTYGAGLVRADNIIFGKKVSAEKEAYFKITPRLLESQFGAYFLNAENAYPNKSLPVPLAVAISWENSSHDLDLSLSTENQSLGVDKQVGKGYEKIRFIPGPGVVYYLHVHNKSKEDVTFTGAATHPIEKLPDNSGVIASLKTVNPIEPSADPDLPTSTDSGQEARLRATLNGHTGFVSSLAFSPNGQIVVSGSWDNTIRLWNPRTEEHLTTLTGHTDRVTSVAFSANGNMLASGSWDKTVRFWNPNSGKFLRSTSTTRVTHETFTSVVAADSHGDSYWFASGSLDDQVWLWYGYGLTTRSSYYRLLGHTHDVSSVAFSADERTLASGSHDHTIKLWNISDRKLRATLKGHTDFVTSVAFNPNGRILASGSSDNTVRLWDVTTEKSITVLKGHTDQVLTVAFSPDGRTLASGSDDQTIHLWDVDSGQQKDTLLGHTSGVTAVAFSPDRRTLASAGGWDNTVRLWDLSPAPTLAPTVRITPSPVVSPDARDNLVIKINISGVQNVAGYQATVQFDPTALRYVNSTNGNYLPIGSHFVEPVVRANQVTLAATSLSGDSDGAGTLATLTFEVVAKKPSSITLSNVMIMEQGLTSIPIIVKDGDVVVSSDETLDVNGDGVIDIEDLKVVSAHFGQFEANQADVNGDNIVDIKDLLLVAGELNAEAAAPSAYALAISTITVEDIQMWLSQAQQLGLSGTVYQKGLAVLQQLLRVLTPKETALLANYPNPFNPETWIPYQLAAPADVTVTIYAVDGVVARTLSLGHQPIGIYQGKGRAAYWDGKNAHGEPVASGLYFYTLTAGDFTATRKMLIQK